MRHRRLPSRRVTAGSRVLVTGAGPIGLLTARVARRFGATFIAVSDVNPQRLEVARRDGVDQIIDVRGGSLNDLASAVDVAIECSGVPAVASAAIGVLQPRGRAVLVGMGLGESVAVPVAALQQREVSVTGAFRYANTYTAALEMASWLDLDSLVSHRFALADTEKALRASREDPTCVKAIVVPTP